MSKIFNSELMSAFADMDKEGYENLSSEDKQIYSSIFYKKERIETRFNDLIRNFNSLDSNQLNEFKELKETLDEMNEMKAQRMDTEEIQQYIDNLSPREDTMPVLGKMWLEALKKVQESKKTR